MILVDDDPPAPHCPVADVAIRARAALLHRDADFGVIARSAPLNVAAA